MQNIEIYTLSALNYVNFICSLGHNHKNIMTKKEETKNQLFRRAEIPNQGASNFI